MEHGGVDLIASDFLQRRTRQRHRIYPKNHDFRKIEFSKIVFAVLSGVVRLYRTLKKHVGRCVWLGGGNLGTDPCFACVSPNHILQLGKSDWWMGMIWILVMRGCTEPSKKIFLKEKKCWRPSQFFGKKNPSSIGGDTLPRTKGVYIHTFW